MLTTVPGEEQGWDAPSLVFQFLGLCMFTLGFCPQTAPFLCLLVHPTTALQWNFPVSNCREETNILPFQEKNFHLFVLLFSSLWQKAVVMCAIKYASLSGFLGRLWRSFLPKFLQWKFFLVPFKSMRSSSPYNVCIFYFYIFALCFIF